MRRLNIRWRLTLWFGIAMIVLLVIRSFWIYFVMDWRLTSVTDARLNSDLGIIETLIHDASNREQVLESLELFAGRHGDLDIGVFTPANRPLFRHAPVAEPPLATPRSRNGNGPRRNHFTMLKDGERRRAVTANMPSSIGPLSVELSRSTQDKWNEVRDFSLTLFTTLPMVFAAALAVGYFVSSRALTPVDKMISAAQRITVRRLDQRIEVPESRDELARLAQTLNEMINRLHQSFEEMRRFTADAAHDLRTPVTALRTAVEVSLMADTTTDDFRHSLQTVLDEAVHLSRLTNQLLDLSREDHGVQPHSSEPVRLDEILKTAVEDLRMASEQKRISVEMREIGKWTVPGDPVRLRRVFMNLLDNAVQYTSSGGRIWIEGTFDSDQATVSISDNGPGVPAEDLPHIFDRFRRVDKARNRQMGGTGLGLAICKSIVEAHGGSIRMESTVGRGTTVTVELLRTPVATAPAVC